MGWRLAVFLDLRPPAFFMAALESSLHTLAVLFVVFDRGFRATEKLLYLLTRQLDTVDTVLICLLCV